MRIEIIISILKICTCDKSGLYRWNIRFSSTLKLMHNMSVTQEQRHFDRTHQVASQSTVICDRGLRRLGDPLAGTRRYHAQCSKERCIHNFSAVRRIFTRPGKLACPPELRASECLNFSGRSNPCWVVKIRMVNAGCSIMYIHD